MNEYADRYRRIAATFRKRVREVPSGAWDNPAPCEGWVARDVVAHLVEWVPAFFANYAGFELPRTESLDDPAASWEPLDDALQAALDDPAVAAREFEMRGQQHTIASGIDMFVTGDVLVHTWDLARATGQDETLDADEVHRMYDGMLPMDEMLRRSGHYGPRVDVPDDADEQTKLIAFTGRQP